MRVHGQSDPSSSYTGGLSRRRFLGVVLGSTGLALAAACQSAPAPAPTAAPARPAEAAKPTEPARPAAPAATSAPAAPAATSAPAQAAPAQAKPADTAKPAAGGEQPKPGGTVVVARPNEGNGFDPATSLGGPTTEVEGLVYEGLVRPKPIAPQDVKPGAGIASALEPGLAESWKTSEDGLTWTFTLRKSVKFHDGTPLDADAVIVNIDRMLNENSPFYFKGKMVNAIARWGQVAAYRAVDPGTVEIKLKNKYAPFLGAIAHPNAGIVSPTALKKYGEDIAKNLVGTGPFKFTEWRPNETITFERNPEWWGGKANLDKVVFRNIPEPSVQTAQLQAGSVNMAVGINPDSVPILEKDPKLDPLIDQARREYDPARRKAMYVDLQKQIYDLSLWVYVNFVDILMASHTSVKNVQFGDQFSARAFENTWIAS